MTDREAYKLIISEYTSYINAISKAWGEEDMPTIPRERIRVCHQLVKWAENKVIELNQKDYQNEFR